MKKGLPRRSSHRRNCRVVPRQSRTNAWLFAGAAAPSGAASEGDTSRPKVCRECDSVSSMISLRIARQRSAVAIATTLNAAALSLRCSVATPACRDCDHDDLPPRRTRNYWGKPARKCDPFGAKQESRRAGRGCDESGGGAAAAPKDVTHPKTLRD